MVMQPPTTSAYLREYIDRLKQDIPVTSTEKKPTVNQLSTRIEQQTEKISSWINDLPETLQKQSYSIDAIIRLANLVGLYAPYPSPQHVAIALRRSGFRQVRSWRKVDRNRRLWIWDGN